MIASTIPAMSMRYKARRKLTLDECRGMYALFSQYYHNTPGGLKVEVQQRLLVESLLGRIPRLAS